MISTAYRQLLQDYVPRPIRNERARLKSLRSIQELMARPRLTRAEGELLDVLVALVEQYESIEFPTPVNPANRMLAHLIESKGITPVEVAAETEIPRSTISAILDSNRAVTMKQAAKLAAFFGVSSSVFLPPATRSPRKES